MLKNLFCSNHLKIICLWIFIGGNANICTHYHHSAYIGTTCNQKTTHSETYVCHKIQMMQSYQWKQQQTTPVFKWKRILVGNSPWAGKEIVLFNNFQQIISLFSFIYQICDHQGGFYLNMFMIKLLVRSQA